MAHDIRQTGRRIRMDISAAHPDSKGNAGLERELAGHFSGFAREVRINQLHFVLMKEGIRLLDEPLMIHTPAIKLQEGNVVKAKFRQVYVIARLTPEPVRAGQLE